MANFGRKQLGTDPMAVIVMIVSLVLTALLGGCANQPGSNVISAKPHIDYDRVMVVPERVIESCEALPQLTDGNKAGVLDWAINAHSNHGICMFRKDLSDDFLKAAAQTGARVELFGADPPAPVPVPDAAKAAPRE